MTAIERSKKMLADHHDMAMSPFMQPDEADALATLLALAEAVHDGRRKVEYAVLEEDPTRNSEDEWMRITNALAALTETT